MFVPASTKNFLSAKKISTNKNLVMLILDYLDSHTYFTIIPLLSKSYNQLVKNHGYFRSYHQICVKLKDDTFHTNLESVIYLNKLTALEKLKIKVLDNGKNCETEIKCGQLLQSPLLKCVKISKIINFAFTPQIANDFYQIIKSKDSLESIKVSDTFAKYLTESLEDFWVTKILKKVELHSFNSFYSPELPMIITLLVALNLKFLTNFSFHFKDSNYSANDLNSIIDMLKIWTRSTSDLKYLHISADNRGIKTIALSILEIACKESNLMIDGISLYTLQDSGGKGKDYEAKIRPKLISMKKKIKHSLLFEMIEIIETEKKIYSYLQEKSEGKINLIGHEDFEKILQYSFCYWFNTFTGKFPTKFHLKYFYCMFSCASIIKNIRVLSVNLSEKNRFSISRIRIPRRYINLQSNPINSSFVRFLQNYNLSTLKLKRFDGCSLLAINDLSSYLFQSNIVKLTLAHFSADKEFMNTMLRVLRDMQSLREISFNQVELVIIALSDESELENIYNNVLEFLEIFTEKMDMIKIKFSINIRSKLMDALNIYDKNFKQRFERFLELVRFITKQNDNLEELSVNFPITEEWIIAYHNILEEIISKHRKLKVINEFRFRDLSNGSKDIKNLVKLDHDVELYINSLNSPIFTQIRMIPIIVGNIVNIYPECASKIFEGGYNKKFEFDPKCFNQLRLDSFHDEIFFLLTIMRSLVSLKTIIISKPLLNSTLNNYFIKIVSYLHQPLKIDLYNCKIIDSTIITYLKSLPNLKALKLDFISSYYSSQDILSFASQIPTSLNLTIHFSLLESILNNSEITRRLKKLIISLEGYEKNCNKWLQQLCIMFMNSEYRLCSLKIQNYMWKRKFLNCDSESINITRVKLTEYDYYFLYKIIKMQVLGKIYEIDISETGELSKVSEKYLIKILKLLFPERLIAMMCIGEWSDIYEIGKFTKKLIF